MDEARTQHTTARTTPQPPHFLRTPLSALLEAADFEEQLHAELAALHAQRADLVRARRRRLEHYAFGFEREAGR